MTFIFFLWQNKDFKAYKSNHKLVQPYLLLPLEISDYEAEVFNPFTTNSIIAHQTFSFIQALDNIYPVYFGNINSELWFYSTFLMWDTFLQTIKKRLLWKLGSCIKLHKNTFHIWKNKTFEIHLHFSQALGSQTQRSHVSLQTIEFSIHTTKTVNMKTVFCLIWP